MRFTALLCSLVLGACLSVLGQQTPDTRQTPPAGTPPTFPQQKPDTSTTRDHFPPDSAPAGEPADAGESAPARIEGCLGQSEGNFVLTSQAGILYQLQGDSAELGRYVGQEVAISGQASTSPGSPSSATGTQSGTSGSQTQDDDKESSSSTTQNSQAPLNSFTVSSVRKVADTCKSSTR